MRQVSIGILAVLLAGVFLMGCNPPPQNKSTDTPPAQQPTATPPVPPELPAPLPPPPAVPQPPAPVPAPAPKTGGTLVIDASVFGEYPAALVSLDTGTIIRLDDAMKAKRAPADLWIEPNDPEIAGLKAEFEGMVHPGEDTQIAVPTSLDYAATTTLPAGATWGRKMPKESIVKGAVFLVKTSAGQFYKVRIDEATKASIKLTFAKLK